MLTGGNWLPRLGLLPPSRSALRRTSPLESKAGLAAIACRRRRLAREGSAPPTSGCRPDAILFHHRALIGCRGWICTNISAFKGRCPTVRRPGKNWPAIRSSKSEGWWPARVTLPVLRIKSPLHHFNACRPRIGSSRHSSGERRRMLAAGLAPALATFSTSCLCIGLRERRKWILQPVMLRQDFFTKEIRRLLHGGEMVAVPGAAPGAAGL